MEEGNTSWKMQIASDLHLEAFVGSFGLNRFAELLQEKYHVAEGQIPVLGECLALLGDIGYPTRETYRDFLLQQAERFETVFVLAGNHEFYSVGSVVPEYEETKDCIRAICQQAPKKNIHFLDRTSVEYKGYRILGCTLWSHIPPGTDAAATIEKGGSDYKKIYVKDETSGRKRKATVADTVGWHTQDVEWLKSEIAKAKEKNEKVVVLTHHAPTREHSSNPKFVGSAVASMYATDLTAMFDEPLVAWLFGHTHWSSVQQVNGVLVASNQAGYFNEAGSTNYEPYFRISFPPAGAAERPTLSTARPS